MVALAVVVLGSLLFVGIAWRYHAVVMSEARDRTARLSFLLSEQAARTFEAVDFTLRGFEPLIGPTVSSPAPQVDALLQRRVSELSFVQVIRIFDIKGRVLLSSDHAVVGTTDPGCLAALRSPDAPSLAIGCTAGDVGASGRAAIAVARRLSDPDGRFKGVIVAEIDPSYFSRFFGHLGLGSHAVVTLSESHGHVLLASIGPTGQSEASRQSSLVPPTERARLSELDRAAHGKITAVHATDGYPLSVLVGIDRSEVDARWWRVVAPSFALLLAAAALLLVLARNLERHRAERALALQRAAVAQKLELVGQMTASVAHDFRNVLTALQGSVRLLRKRAPDEAVLGEAAATLARGNAMVDRLLAFSRRQDLQLETHDLNKLVTELQGTLRHLAGFGTTVIFDLAPGLPACRLDRVQFDAALMNLVVNARQAMAEGGSVTIRTRSLPGSLVEAEVAVSDTGCGMDAALLKRVFEPFFTTKAQSGTGLGLAQVQGFVQEIGGQVSIDSTVGVGTTVALRLPGLPIAAARPAAPARMTLDPV